MAFFSKPDENSMIKSKTAPTQPTPLQPMPSQDSIGSIQAISFNQEGTSFNRTLPKITTELTEDMIRGNQAVELLNSIIYMPKLYEIKPVDSIIKEKRYLFAYPYWDDFCDDYINEDIRKADGVFSFLTRARLGASSGMFKVGWTEPDTSSLFAYTRLEESKVVPHWNGNIDESMSGVYDDLFRPEVNICLYNSGHVLPIGMYLCDSSKYRRYKTARYKAQDWSYKVKLISIINNVTKCDVSNYMEALDAFAEWIGVRKGTEEYDVYNEFIELSTKIAEKEYVSITYLQNPAKAFDQLPTKDDVFKCRKLHDTLIKHLLFTKEVKDVMGVGIYGSKSECINRLIWGRIHYKDLEEYGFQKACAYRYLDPIKKHFYSKAVGGGGDNNGLWGQRLCKCDVPREKIFKIFPDGLKTEQSKTKGMSPRHTYPIQ